MKTNCKDNNNQHTKLKIVDYRDIIPSRMHGTPEGDLINSILKALTEKYDLVEKVNE